MHVSKILSATTVATALGTTAIAAAALGTTAAPALAHGAGRHHVGRPSAVFVQTDNLRGNSIAVYRRGSDGRLSDEHIYSTGGKGGQLSGSQVDHLSSQGSLQYDAAAHRLFAVNAASDTITTFAVDGTRLRRLQVISSGGTFPVSLTVHGNVLYVLNALDGGRIRGYRLVGGRLKPIAGSARALGLNPNTSPQFVNTPGQVSFTPSGRQLLVTTKANTNAVDVFSVFRSGKLSNTPTTTTLMGAVPFGVAYTPGGRVAIVEAGSGTVANFTIAPSGALTQISSVATGQTASCWLTADGHLLFDGNAGSASESTIHVAANGRLTLTATTSTDAGTVDSTIAGGGRYLYVQTGGAGIVDEYSVSRNGGLIRLGAVNVPHAAGGEGIAAS